MGALVLILTIANVAPLFFSAAHLIRDDEDDRERWLAVFCVNACTFALLGYLSIGVVRTVIGA